MSFYYSQQIPHTILLLNTPHIKIFQGKGYFRPNKLLSTTNY
ncbi:hypothetical protein SAMN05421780_105179 [Flexibacter flexilis DSM 6793]|uniref:Uncharacterized protein n=1 Tax=Flexibacter flexilis DSM 6793 TaxID=927664 RepID=A0A1I1JB63_9BACT|nr:hypothetical protein SAMN05421780_105179 [Flexibacter flexilis DSM 6793]